MRVFAYLLMVVAVVRGARAKAPSQVQRDNEGFPIVAVGTEVDAADYPGVRFLGRPRSWDCRTDLDLPTHPTRCLYTGKRIGDDTHPPPNAKSFDLLFAQDDEHGVFFNRCRNPYSKDHEGALCIGFTNADPDAPVLVIAPDRIHLSPTAKRNLLRDLADTLSLP